MFMLDINALSDMMDAASVPGGTPGYPGSLPVSIARPGVLSELFLPSVVFNRLHKTLADRRKPSMTGWFTAALIRHHATLFRYSEEC